MSAVEGPEGLARDCDPTWRDDPAGLDALCERGARELYGPAVLVERDVETVTVSGGVL